MELAVLNTQGKETGRKVVLSDAVFGVEANDHAIYLDVKQYLADQRQGTHKSKQRNEVAGSTRKLKRQKGTGGARAGSIKSPLFPGGGRIFGPQPRDYSFKLNKKLKQLARRSALTYKAQAGVISVVEPIKRCCWFSRSPMQTFSSRAATSPTYSPCWRRTSARTT